MEYVSGDLSAELRAYLIDALYAHPAQFRRDARWAMSAEWWDECRRMTGADGRPLWEPALQCLYPDGPLLLLGKLVEVRDGAGAPHLEKPGS
jgi:HK97 family phage major capsid protein